MPEKNIDLRNVFPNVTLTQALSKLSERKEINRILQHSEHPETLPAPHEPEDTEHEATVEEHNSQEENSHENGANPHDESGDHGEHEKHHEEHHGGHHMPAEA